MVIINESGLYSLMMSSKLPSAKKFKRWVTSEVLPLGMYLGKSSGWVYSVVKEKGSKFNYKNYQIKVGDAQCISSYIHIKKKY